MLCGCARKAFPDSFQDHDDPDEIYGLIDDYQDFLIRVIKNVGHEFDYVRVFESTFISSPELSKRLNNQEYIILFMGYPHITVEQKLNQLRRYGESNPQCWTNQVSDRKLIEHISHFIEVSIKQKHDCNQNGIMFIDISSNFEAEFTKAKEHVLNNINHASENS